MTGGTIGSRIRADWPVVALLCLAAVCLSPAINTGYWAEDVYYSAMVPASPILRQSSWWTETWLGVKHSILIGRFYPITPIITAVAFRLFQSVTVYKTYIVAVTLVDLILYHALIRRLTRDAGFAALALACVVPLIQFRLTVDPMLGYYAQIQWVIAAFFVSLIWLARALEGAGRRFLIGSALAYLACTLAYELTYPLVLIPVWLIVQARPGWRRGVLLGLPFVAAAGFAAGMTLLVRRLYPSPNYVHTTDCTLIPVLQALGWQISAGLPISYYLADPLDLFSQGHNLGHWARWLLRPGALLVALAAVTISFAILRRLRGIVSGTKYAIEPIRLAGLGLLLATLPAILTGISPYHRNYIGPGVGWIGVMVQYYGVGLLAALGIWRFVAVQVEVQVEVQGSGGRNRCGIVAAVLAATLGLTFRANQEVATAMNAAPGSRLYRQFAADHGTAWHWQRRNLIAAVDAGVMDEVPDGSRVQLDNLYPLWHDTLYGQFFYSKQTSKRIETLPTVLPTRLPADAPLFRVHDLNPTRQMGLVLVVPVGASTHEGRLFVRHPAIQPSLQDLVSLDLVGQVGTAPALAGLARSRVVRLGTDLPVIRVGAGWGLFAVGSAAQEVDLTTLHFGVAAHRVSERGEPALRR